MRDFKEYDGPMAYWPVVEAVPGIEKALQQLNGRWRLILATNAPASGQALVRAALERAGLDLYFEAIFTAKELGLRKPDPSYYYKVLASLQVDPSQAVMIGDDYQGDILGAKNAGLRAIWFNPSGSLAPSPHPQYDAEVLHLEGLPPVIANLGLPDYEDCLIFLQRQGAQENLLGHCRGVAAIAYRLAVWLRQAGCQVDPLLAHRGGLLHDLDKISSRKHNQAHGELGEKLLNEMGYPALAEITRRHVMFSILDPERAPCSWEEKLVYYADKVVEGDRFATLEKRYEGLHLRYPQFSEAMERCRPKILALEAEICHLLDLDRQGLYDRLSALELIADAP